jgi:alpha-1,2-mannosyltransferase
MTRTNGGMRWAALGIWLLAFLGIAGDVIRRPVSHSTTPTYRAAATNWWAGIDPYTYNSHSGFFYFPQAAILYTPFTWGPVLLGDLLWRAAVFALFAYALSRLARFFLAQDGHVRPGTFLILTLLAVPSSLASLRNAQFDLPLAALIILAMAEIAAARWVAATIWLCLAVALKPLAVVPLLLFGALYLRTLAPRLALGLVVTFLLPFINPHPAFVANEYRRCAQTLLWAAQPHEPKFSDLSALFEHLHLTLPDTAWTALRLIIALAFLGLGALALHRRGRPGAAWSIGALAAAYLVLFNPRTETCSYVLLAPFTASLALLEWPARRWLAWALGVGSICCACDAIPGLFHLTDRWLKPLVALLFVPVIIAFIAAKRGDPRHHRHPVRSDPHRPT